MRRKTTATAPAWRRWYKSSLWQVRRRAQLDAEPLCQWCRKLGRTTPATDVHHVQAHKGNWTLFSTGPLESLCQPCHASEGQREDAGGIRRGGDVNGNPIDARHPWNKARGGGVKSLG